MNWYIVFFSLINLSLCIYEDQIGKFDWRQTYVGRIKLAQFDTSSTAKRLIVATEENVLAALNLKTGSLVWRQVLESASSGNIHMLHLTSGDTAVTVSGSNPYLVRGWDAATGIIAWEWSMTLQDDTRADFSEWWLHNNRLMHLLPKFGSHLEVSWYNVVTGENSGHTSKLPAAWANDGCIFSAPYYTCMSGNPGPQQILLSLDVSSNAVQLISKPVMDFLGVGIEGNLRPLDGNTVTPGFIVDDEKIVLIKNNGFQLLSTKLADPTASATVVDTANGPVLMQTWSDKVKGFRLAAHSVSTGAEVPDIGSNEVNQNIPEPEITAAMCTKSKEQLVCRVLVTAADDASHLVHQAAMCTAGKEQLVCRVLVTAADDASHLVHQAGQYTLLQIDIQTIKSI
ncbi:hypothetical protein NE865_13691 [Phthorimaea operculella]|nr:hypothetical protein NE865_13691 [Phthorimaea operculella]